MYSAVKYRLYGIEQLEARRLLSAGYLDTSFNKSGQTSLNDGAYLLHADDVVVRSDGKSIESGIALEKSPSSQTDDFALARFNADGTPDKTFGNLGNGLEVINSGSVTASYVALQSDNKIVTVNVGSANDAHFTVVRYTANGMLDSTFGTGGIATIPISGATNLVAHDIVIQRDGKIVIAGQARSGSINNNTDGVVVRLNINGTVDSSFGSNGHALIGLGNDEQANAVALDYAGNTSNNPDYGKIVVVGDTVNGSTTQFFIARLKTNGQIDTSFHHTGKFASSFVSEYKYSNATAVVVQASNEIVIAGTVGLSVGGTHHFGIIRLNPNGLGDSTFGPSNGQTEVNFGVNVSVTAAAIISTGEILVSGVGFQQMDMVLLKSNGIVDQAFGTNTGVQADENGRDVTSAPVFADSKSGLALAPGGKFVVSCDQFFVLQRYDGRAPETATIYTITPNAYEQGKVPAAFDIVITPNASATTRVFYTVGGTATSPFSILRTQVDYSGVNKAPPPPVNTTGSTAGFSHLNQGYVDIPAGHGFATVFITPNDDTRAEGDESVIFTLAPDLAYDINPIASSATAVIHDNDAPLTLVKPTADAYVQDGSNAGKMFGASQQLQVGKSSTSGNNRIAYLKFDLTLTPSVINSAKLQIFGKLNNASPKNVPVGVYSVANTSWTESGINFNNKPALGSSALSTVNLVDTAVRGYLFDVTSYIKPQRAAGHNTVTLAIQMPANSTNFAIFNSREGPSTTPVELLIT